MELKSKLLRWLHRGSDPGWGKSTSDLDLTAVARTVDRLGLLFGPGRYFELDVAGWENIPPPPVLLVSNHSGGTTIPDVWGLMAAWYRRFGRSRPAHVLAHEMVFSNRYTGRYFARRGVLRASRLAALAALEDRRRDVIVMPGGDLDTWRPYRERYQVRFHGRTGYAWVALKAGVPIVPVAHAGAHETLLVLTNGQRIAKAIGLQALTRSEIFPVHLSLPWGLGIGPWPHLPTPAVLRYRFGRAISPPARDPAREPDEADVRALDEETRGQVQELLDKLRLDEEARARGSRAGRALDRLRRLVQ